MPRVESHMNAAWLWTTIFPFIQYTTALRMLAGFYMGQIPLCYGLQTFPFVQHTMALRELNLHGMDSLISTYGNSILREWHHSNLPSQHNQNANYTHTHTHTKCLSPPFTVHVNLHSYQAQSHTALLFSSNIPFTSSPSFSHRPSHCPLSLLFPLTKPSFPYHHHFTIYCFRSLSLKTCIIARHTHTHTCLSPPLVVHGNLLPS